MRKFRKFRKWSAIVSTVLIATQFLSAMGVSANDKLSVGVPVVKNVSTSDSKATKSVYEQRFLDLYGDIKDKDNGYFNEQGIPYHSVETLMVEAPDQGHESTSETASYLLWLEAMNGKFTGDYSGVSSAWDIIENYYIPTDEDQPGQKTYNPNSPATYAAEYPLPDYYPSELQFDVKVGQDPLYNELKNTYGKPQMYGMHWLIDVDNFYGYGSRGDGVSTPSYINTYQRGQQESVWETIPHPSWEDYSWGGTSGFLPYFTGDKTYSKQWRYTIASDADARLVQAMYRANQWAKEDSVSLDTYVDKASKVGDYLRYSLFDKYFMKVGSEGLTAGTGRESAHYLLSWYYSWGGAVDGTWSWRIGSSHNHFGYQNPFAAWVLSKDSEFIPESATAQSDWSKSLDRQLEFYQWLQSSEGGIAGGATNSYNGSYDEYPEGTSTFYGMAYDEDPVYEDPGSNQWFGMQCWSMQRIAELYYESGDVRAKALLDKWAEWVQSVVILKDDGTFLIPSTLKWSGQPDTWTGSYTGNKDLHVEVSAYGTDIGVASSLANTLTYYAAGLKQHAPNEDYSGPVNTAKEILNRMWNLYRDDIGLGVVEELNSFNERFFDQEVSVPDNYTGVMANGDKIEKGATFFSIRSGYQNDPDYARLVDCYEKGETFTMVYHRFWAQSEAAIANGVMAEFFPEDTTGPNVELPIVTITSPVTGTSFDYTSNQTAIQVTAEASVKDSTISKVDFYADNVFIGTVTNGNGTVSFTPTKEGMDVNGRKEITLTAIATSALGASATSAAVKISVQFKVAEKPVVTILSPVDGTVVDATTGKQTVTVSANATVKDGEIASVILYADGKELARSSGPNCSAVYTTPDGYAATENELKTVVFTAKAVTTEGMSAEAVPVSIKVKLPVNPVTPDQPKINVTIQNQGGTSTNTLGGQFVVTSDRDTDLSKVTIRYYYTLEDAVKQNVYVDGAGLSCSKAPWYVNLGTSINAKVVQVSGDQYYLEITCSDSQILDAGGRLSIGIRVCKETWTNYDQSNDYSYKNGAVVLYNGKVVTGTMPY